MSIILTGLLNCATIHYCARMGGRFACTCNNRLCERVNVSASLFVRPEKIIYIYIIYYIYVVHNSIPFLV